MGILEGSVLCRSVVCRKHAGVSDPLVKTSLARTTHLESRFWGWKGKFGGTIRVGAPSYAPLERKHGTTHCSFSSSSDGNGSMAGKFNESDGDYVNSSVIEAVEVNSGSDGFIIKMRDGRNLRCVHNNPQGGRLPDYAPLPAIVLKIEDGSDLLLPIIVLEMPSALLLAALRDVQIARPTVYHLVKEMIEKMGYTVQLVRVTRRVHEAYFAELYLAKVGNEKERISFDLRPSDAINIAVRCKALIQVNRHVAYSDGMRIVEPAKRAVKHTASDRLLFQELDRPDGKLCFDSIEFEMVRSMLVAVREERYKDAARLRKRLALLRAKRRTLAL